jgi:hypothetical protein
MIVRRAAILPRNISARNRGIRVARYNISARSRICQFAFRLSQQLCIVDLHLQTDSSGGAGRTARLAVVPIVSRPKSLGSLDGEVGVATRC